MPNQQTDADVYKESDSFVPNPTHQYGTLDTSGTAGAAHSRLEEVTPVFDVAKAQNAIIAKRAVDPDDPEVPSYLVTMPPGTNFVPVDVNAIEDRVAKQGAAAEENPIVVGGPTASQVAAAEETGTGSSTQPEATGVTTGSTTPQQQKPNTQTQPTS